MGHGPGFAYRSAGGLSAASAAGDVVRNVHGGEAARARAASRGLVGRLLLKVRPARPVSSNRRRPANSRCMARTSTSVEVAERRRGRIVHLRRCRRGRYGRRGNRPAVCRQRGCERCHRRGRRNTSRCRRTWSSGYGRRRGRRLRHGSRTGRRCGVRRRRSRSRWPRRGDGSLRRNNPSS